MPFKGFTIVDLATAMWVISVNTFALEHLEAFRAEKPEVVLDEVDKADMEFPNDLYELDRMSFTVRTGDVHTAE